MSAFYDNLQITVDSMLADKGQTCTLGIVTNGTYDPATGISTPSTSSVSVHAALFAFPARDVDGSLIRVGDVKALVSAKSLAVTPRPSHSFTDAAGSVYTIINAKPLAPSGTVLLWTLQLRGV